MKKFILIPGLVLCIVLLIMSLNAGPPEVTRVVVQTDLVPVPMIQSLDLSGAHMPVVMWVKDNKSHAEPITFSADEATLEGILIRLSKLTRDQTRMSDGKAVPCSWQLVKKGETTYLNLVYPVQPAPPRPDGC